MARTGVSYNEVAEAATQLMGQGRNPTVEQVRILLGTGSSTTIGNHLRHWKTHQDTVHLVSAKESIPSELVAVMKGLWEQVVNHSQKQMTVIESGYQQTILELEQEVEKYKKNNQRWQKMFDQWVVEKKEIDNEKLTLEQALEFAQKENVSLGAKQDALLHQLQNKQERIDELHGLHKQIQENLEHYRESTREQRLLDQQQHDQQKQQLQSEIKTLNEQLIMWREKASAIQQQHQILEQSYVSIEKTHTQIQLDFRQLTIELQETEKNKNEHQYTSQHWQDQYKALQKLLDERSSQLIDEQTESKLLSRQLIDGKRLREHAWDKNKLLSNEKLMLEKEKSQIEGQLKQMQKMISA
jgi:chromosome segregation ATPase